VVGWGAAPQASVPGWLSNVVAVAAGGTHSLALRADGTVAAWGASTYGKTNVPGTLSNVVAVAAGGQHSLALQANGTLVGWGYSGYGVTNQPATLGAIVTIASGGNHNAALSPNRPPIAVSPQFGVSVSANHDGIITLIGRDDDFDLLSSTITALPSRGTFYQYAGGVRGAAILSAGTPVQDAGNRVIFAPGTNEFGTPYTWFSFRVSDGDAESPLAAVTIKVDPLVAPVVIGTAYTETNGFQIRFTGDSNTVYCVWASTNLVYWDYLAAAVQPSPGQFIHQDATAGAAPRRFYRISTACSP
jgi:hypothetical protein